MDTVTHIAIGACMGEVFAGKKLGRKALLWGALAQTIPDFDGIASFWLPVSKALLAHRGFTHSLLFSVLCAILLAGLAQRIHRSSHISFKQWILFFIAALAVHIFIDAFNNYGTGWFEPFSDTRISFDTLYVVDPFFSLMLVVAATVLFIIPHHAANRAMWWKMSFGFAVFYLGYSLVNKAIIIHQADKDLASQKIVGGKLFTTPAPLQTWLWFLAKPVDSGFFVGYHSVFEGNKPIKWSYFPQQKNLLAHLNNNEEIKDLQRFSEGLYTIEYYHDTLVLNDLRFGQEVGWMDTAGRFVFHFYLNNPDGNEMVVQRGRFARWDKNSLKSLIKRIIDK